MRDIMAKSSFALADFKPTANHVRLAILDYPVLAKLPTEL